MRFPAYDIQMRSDELYSKISGVVEPECYSEERPSFIVRGTSVSVDSEVNAVALAIALAGGNAVISRGNENAARKVNDLIGGEGIFALSRVSGRVMLTYSSGGSRITIFAGEVFDAVGEVSVFP